MTLTTHAAIGALLATAVPTATAGFFVGVALHLLVDVIPHGDNNLNDGYKTKTKKRHAIAYVTTDACLAIAVILFSIAATGDSTAQENLIFSATILGSIFPDLLVGLGYLYKNSLFKLFTKIHFIFHDSVSRRYGDVPLVFGLGYQAIFLAFALQRLAS
jgi:hypothetical protein